MASALGRRRGTTQQRRLNPGLLVGLVVALVASALLLGILLGTHLLLSSPERMSQVTQKEQHATVRGAVVEPHQVLRGVAPVKQELPDNPDADQGDDEAQDDGDRDADDEQAEKQDDKAEKEDDEVEEGDDQMNDTEEEELKDEEKIDDLPEPPNQQRIMDGKGALPSDPYPYNLEQLVRETHDFTTWTAPGGSRFEEYASGDSPYLLTDAILRQSDELARSRRVHVRNAMKFAWSAYETYAFGHDEILPQTKAFGDNWGGMGTTLVDSLDTLWLMNLKDEFWRARDWVRDHLQHEQVGSVSVFETTIRSLGGLLSAYDWSGDEAFLAKANDLGSRLFMAFSTTSGIPSGQVNLGSGRTGNIGWAGGNAITAEAGSLQLEFRYLAKVTDHKEYAEKSENVFKVLRKMNPPHGLYPYYVRNNQETPTFANNHLTFGAMGDSLYEYMLKVWLQGGKTEPLYREMYDEAIQGMHDELLQRSTPSGLAYIADKNNGQLDHKMDHLVCFMGGLLALGAYTDPQGLESDRAQRDLKTGKVRTSCSSACVCMCCISYFVSHATPFLFLDILRR